MTSIRNRKNNVAARDRLQFTFHDILLQLDKAGAQSEFAPVRHGITRIDAQIQQDLVKLSGIAHYGREPGIDFGLDSDRAREGILRQPYHLRGQRFDLKEAGLAAGATSKGKDLLDHL